MAKYRNRTVSLVNQRGDDTQGGGFTGAIGAQQSKKIALLYLQGYTLQGLESITISLAQILNLLEYKRLCESVLPLNY